MQVVTPAFDSRLIERLVDKAISEVGLANDGESVSFVEFNRIMKTSDIALKMRMRL